MRRSSSDADPPSVIMAVELLQVSIFDALRQREAAVRSLLPEVDDSNAAVITAVSMVLGQLLAHQSTSQSAYSRGVAFAARILTVNRDKFFAVARAAIRRAGQ